MEEGRKQETLWGVSAVIPTARVCLLLGSRGSCLVVLWSHCPLTIYPPLWPAQRLYPSPDPPVPWEETPGTGSWGSFWRALCGHRDWELTSLSRLELSLTASHRCGAHCCSCCSAAHSAPTGQVTMSLTWLKHVCV